MKTNFVTKICARNLILIFLLTESLVACQSTYLETPQSIETLESTKIPQSNLQKPTKTPSPSPSNEPTNDNSQIKTFSLQDINEIRPADVLKEVKFAGTGGGKGCGRKYSHPTIAEVRDSFEWMAVVDVYTCGWRVDEIVQVILSFPDGRSIVKELHAQQDSGVWYIYRPKIGDPIGEYSFTFSGSSSTIESKSNIYVPDGPRLYYVQDIESLILYSFQPNERVRLLLYSPKDFDTLSFYGWQEYQTDASGQLLVKTNKDWGEYIVVGDKSGMISRSGNIWTDPVYQIYFPTPVPTETYAILCPGAMPSRLKIGEWIRLSFQSISEENPIRESAGTSSKIIKYLAT